jgi:hypothetical protein
VGSSPWRPVRSVLHKTNAANHEEHTMSHEIRPAASRVRVSRPVLWLLLAVFLVGNLVANTAGLHVLIGAGFGLATLACAAALIVQHYDNRRRSSS